MFCICRFFFLQKINFCSQEWCNIFLETNSGDRKPQYFQFFDNVPSDTERRAKL